MKRTAVYLLIAILSCFQAARAEGNTSTILLLGTDEFIGTVTSQEKLSRADAIFVLAIHNNGTARLLSVDRDYLVTLPGGIGRNKLCTSTYFGGPGLCVQAVNELLDLNISLYAQMDVTATEKLIDALGGIDVEIFAPELSVIRYVSDWQRVFSAAGIHTMNGAQAVATMRSRDIQIDTFTSDKNRSDRQQRVLAACMKKLNQMSIGRILPLLSDALPLVDTNIAMSDLTAMAKAILLSGDIRLEQQRTPTGAYQNKIVSMHSVVIADDMDAEIAAVHAFLYGEP
jgi:polyisoprenyl-teichoic acid--peptidoglycan teichoic acid transferase